MKLKKIFKISVLNSYKKTVLKYEKYLNNIPFKYVEDIYYYNIDHYVLQPAPYCNYLAYDITDMEWKTIIRKYKKPVLLHIYKKKLNFFEIVGLVITQDNDIYHEEPIFYRKLNKNVHLDQTVITRMGKRP